VLDREILWDFVSLGGGPAGLNAALYAERKGLKTAVIALDLGGQLKNTASIDNYLGFEQIEASELIEKFTHHLRSLSVPILTGVEVCSIEKKADQFEIGLSDGTTVHSRTVLYALGGAPRKLLVPGESIFAGKGVSYCVTCDGPLYKDKTVVVIGGGNSAVDSALDLARIAKQVMVIHRSQFRADVTRVKKLASLPNVTIHLETQVLAIEGKDHVESLQVLDLKTKNEFSISAEGVFIAIGHIPNTGMLNDLVDKNAIGEIIVATDQSTKTPGLFAAGDVTDQPQKQVIIAAAEGAKAALAAAQYCHQ